MPLSVEEIAKAKKAYGVIRDFECTRFSSIVWGSLFLFEALPFAAALAQGTPIDGKFLQEHSAFFMYLALVVFLVIRYRDLRIRSKESRKLVSEIEMEHAGELPYGLENEIQNKSQQKPLLWRLDAFLSRKTATS